MSFSITVAVVVVIVVYYIIDLVLRSLKVGNITDKYILVTGCDSGFGNLAARRFDKLGFRVFAGCLTKDGVKSLTETGSTRLTTFHLDLTSTESIEQAVQLVKQRLPPGTGLWAIINNAGIVGLFAPTEFCSPQDLLSAINVNLVGTVDMTRHFLPLIRKSNGRVVNTTSIAGRLAFMVFPYTASKYAMEAYSDILRREVRSQGIKVSIVEPGAFQTPIFNMEDIVAHLQKAFDRTSPDVQAVYGGRRVIEKTRETMMKLHTCACPDLDLVVDAYTHAITSRFPHTRYVVETDAKWIYIPLSYLPDWISDRILTLLM